MHTISELLNLAKDKSRLSSDRQLAMKLGISNIAPYRTKGVIPDDRTAIELSKLCDLPPELVVSICHLAKTKTREERNVWQHIYKLAAAACIVFVMTIGIFSPTTAQANEAKSFLSCSLYYPLCDLIQNIRAFLMFGIFPATPTKNKTSCARFVL